MTIAFTCPHCGRFTEVADHFAGQSGPCAGCGRTVTIPKPMASTPFGAASYGPSPRRASRGTNTTLVVFLVLGVMCICAMPVLVALLLPAVQAAREAARRAQCTNNLKQIALAMHNYHDVYKCFPAGYTTDQNGRPLHSWRVALLPFMEQQPLYDQLHLDEPWDSPHNMMLAAQMPATFRCPSAPDSGPGSNLTHYVVILSDPPGEGEAPESVFQKNRGMRISEIIDGTSNTVMVVESSEPVMWTQPDAEPHIRSLNLRVNGGAGIGSYHPQGANVAMADGSVHFLSNTVDSQTLRFLISPADRNPIGVPF